MQSRTAFGAVILLAIAFGVAACGGGSSQPQVAPERPVAGILSGQNFLVFRWLLTAHATHYRLLENADGHSGFTQVGADIPGIIFGSSIRISVHLYDFANALYIVQACNQIGCTDSEMLSPRTAMPGTIGYFKASNTDSGDEFGSAVAMSADGLTLAVAALEDSTANDVNGAQDDNGAESSGAVYIFRFNGAIWDQVAYVKAFNAEAGDRFGMSVALSADGTTLAVGAADDSNATGINGDAGDNSAEDAGAVYVFRLDGSDWFQEAYIKASNTGAGDCFGSSVSLRADGNVLAVGASGEDSQATGVDGNDQDDSAGDAGAAYLFRFDGMEWIQEAYIKASNTNAGDRFGSSVSIDDGGQVLAIGADGESSVATGVGGDQDDNSLNGAGAVYVFEFDGGWSQQAYLKPSAMPGGPPGFGGAVDVSGNGDTLVVGAAEESGAATGVNGDQDVAGVDASGAAYLFRFDGTDWSQQAYFKASMTGAGDAFGSSVALTADGNLLAVAAPGEDGNAIGVGGNDADDSAADSGAVYVFRFDGAEWRQQTYVKAPNNGSGDGFGSGVALSHDGGRLAVGAPGEDGAGTGIGGNQDDNSAASAGGVYLY